MSVALAPDAFARGAAAQAVQDTVSVVLPAVTLTRSDGSTVALQDELDASKPVLLNFIFTTCTTICPVMSATFAQLQSALGPEADRVRLVSISIDPEYDTPSRLAEYGREHQAGPSWHLLTGRPSDVTAIQRAFGALAANKMGHAPLTYLRSAGGTDWVRINGLVSAQRLLEEYHKITKVAP